ncbi:flagellar protein FlaG [Dongshaea marina]|uniref:flagellar protein FlaG n=1 Tax=Dongshaea marina TaxID=2047966 RepID=UPI000D3E216A|nr:flagellar protein FlaG [Dongshaea marina]
MSQELEGSRSVLQQTSPAERASQPQMPKPDARNEEVRDNVQQSLAELDPQAVRETMETLNAHVQLMQRQISFSVDESSGRQVIMVFDKNTGEAIKQIPSEDLLQLARNLDKVVGLLFSSQV